MNKFLGGGAQTCILPGNVYRPEAALWVLVDNPWLSVAAPKAEGVFLCLPVLSLFFSTCTGCADLIVCLSWFLALLQLCCHE